MQALYEEIITLPVFPSMTDADVDDAVSAVKKVMIMTRQRIQVETNVALSSDLAVANHCP